ncbi:MAG: HigA family addiction module antidote protein [Scytonematopsis contorta HA4267-MV1]|nr:HigA family addiction module antidote protein [Scytonematopsis contorta HA4267-MV1]
MRVPTHRQPTHPGEMLLEEFLIPMAITPGELGIAINIPEQEINQLVQGDKTITPGIALRLGKYFGTSANFWMNLQLRWDLYHVLDSETEELAKIQPRNSLSTS